MSGGKLEIWKLNVISLIPVLGGVFELIVTLIGLGAVWLWGKGGMWVKHRQLIPA